MENKDVLTPQVIDMDTVFEELKEHLPMPDEHVKEAIINTLTYILSM